jgi:hypothetical protein
MEILRKSILVKLMMFSIFVAICNLIAQEFYLYWTHSWVDIPMHIMGGALVSSIGLWAIYFSPLKEYFFKSNLKIFLISVFIAFTIGFLWEVFELRFGLISYSFIDGVDSTKDMFDDIIGALITGLYFVYNTKTICQE